MTDHQGHDAADIRRAERLLRRAASIRRRYESRTAGVGDSAEMNIPFTRARSKRLEAFITAAGKMVEACALESEAARLMGKPDPHATESAPRRTEEQTARDDIAAAEALEARAVLMESANPGLGASLYEETAKMRRRSQSLRGRALMALGQDPGPNRFPVYESDHGMADRLDREADAHDATGDRELAASKRSAAVELRQRNRRPLKRPDGTVIDVLLEM